MSSFLLTIGLVCMGLYVLLNMFGFGPVVEGNTKGPDAKQKQEWSEALDAKYEEMKKQIDAGAKQVEEFEVRMWKAKAEHEKLSELRLTMLKTKRRMMKNYITYFYNSYNSPDGLNKKGNQMMEGIRNLDDWIKLLQEDPRGDTGGGATGGSAKGKTQFWFLTTL